MFIVYTCVYVNALKSTFDLVIKIKNKKNKKRKKEERERERERERKNEIKEISKWVLERGCERLLSIHYSMNKN